MVMVRSYLSIRGVLAKGGVVPALQVAPVVIADCVQLVDAVVGGAPLEFVLQFRRHEFLRVLPR